MYIRYVYIKIEIGRIDSFRRYISTIDLYVAHCVAIRLT